MVSPGVGVVTCLRCGRIALTSRQRLPNRTRGRCQNAWGIAPVSRSSPDRLLRLLPGVPGAGAPSAGQTSSGGGCQCSRHAFFRAVSARRHGDGWANGKIGPALCHEHSESARKETDRYA